MAYSSGLFTTRRRRLTTETIDLLDHIETCVGEITRDHPATIVLAGDLNQLPLERTGLTQAVHQPTRGNNMLDKVYTCTCTSPTGIPFPPFVLWHPLLKVTIEQSSPTHAVVSALCLKPHTSVHSDPEQQTTMHVSCSRPTLPLSTSTRPATPPQYHSIRKLSTILSTQLQSTCWIHSTPSVLLQ